ncbi:ANE_G0004920.mRNA.1.CDS.1 [Saccharomyces cerevisiae]|nr:AVI_1a_G0004900.mRNA.1.CDS.1 [Saccharomyces cerevisiae]CAI4293979.1 ANE_G0004920.mRNA.1.CDS.1 [Saccharomyces cerevisiae]CAI6511289.1 ANE_G0004920.mRNA.1.CDS.1 [Saccharomyces cerevisiae]CAI7052662.1 AVI_1a_G0004900.mRNA.1.CDS.1 [Saccharomyces cerevisiae]
MPYSPSFILICHTHTDATVYTISNLPYSHILLQSMAHLLTKSVNMHSHHYARHLPQRFIPCAIYP